MNIRQRYNTRNADRYDRNADRQFKGNSVLQQNGLNLMNTQPQRQSYQAQSQYANLNDGWQDEDQALMNSLMDFEAYHNNMQVYYCGICGEETIDPSKYLGSECNHWFCINCINMVLCDQLPHMDKTKCPVCFPYIPPPKPKSPIKLNEPVHEIKIVNIKGPVVETTILPKIEPIMIKEKPIIATYKWPDHKISPYMQLMFELGNRWTKDGKWQSYVRAKDPKDSKLIDKLLVKVEFEFDLKSNKFDSFKKKTQKAVTFIDDFGFLQAKKDALKNGQQVEIAMQGSSKIGKEKGEYRLRLTFNDKMNNSEKVYTHQIEDMGRTKDIPIKIKKTLYKNLMKKD